MNGKKTSLFEIRSVLLKHSGHARLPPLFAKCHAWGIQVWILHGLHLWAAQEVVKGVESVR